VAQNPESLRIDIPERLSGRWGRFNSGDWWFTAAALAVAVIANHFWGGKAGLSVGIVWLCLTIPADYGRLYALFGQWLSNLWLQYVRKDVIWDSREVSIIAQAPITLAVHGIDELGLLHSNNQDTVVIAGEGSNIPSLELEGQYDSHLALAQVIRKAAAIAERRGYDVGWGWVYRTRPLNAASLSRRLENFLHPDAWSAADSDKSESQLTRDDRRLLAYGENMAELLGVTYDYTREVTMAAVCTVEREDFEKRLSKAEAHRLPVAQLAQVVSAELEACGVIDPRPLSPSGIHAYMRGAWDIAHVGDYYDWLLGRPEEEVLTSSNHLPQERIAAGPDYLQVDGSFHAVLWIKQLASRVYPHHLRQLFDIDVPWLSVAQVGVTTRTKSEYAILDRVIAINEEMDTWSGRVHQGPKREKKLQRRRDRQERVDASTYGQDYNILVALHHENRDGLEDSVDKALQRIGLAGLTAERVKGQIWQLPFLLSATTAINIDML
jgi:hypothetical protein